MSTKRTFILGDEWLYYKIYCGARTSDMLLTEAIKPLVEYLVKQGVIDSWFFIRYGDPDFHIRIRFHIPDIEKIGSVILHINKALQKYVEQQVVYKIQTDTYLRELERYGTNSIDASEKLFYWDSATLLEAISMIEDEELYFLFVIKAIDRLLDSFGYTKEAKLQLVSQNGLAFKREFHADKTLNKQLDKKYRGLKNKITLFIEEAHADQNYIILDNLLNHKEENTSVYIQEIKDLHTDKNLEMPLDDLMSSYIHMLVNRAFRSKQRFYELVCYDFLSRYHKTKVRSKVLI
ncbi:thiopeptide-type bacteriocin biosynthesis protein [Aquimarina aquimarini]|uniref:thiopeptide-type bacteriocin biosynthesis protein n=1 Tax=Aquimarina aquimarini TaxID=1191734 RepID=UPI000D55680C|nr:thiopeptide-type bacteriocin biosynthesis protein [Aquimarina aquimarini]